MEKKDDTLQLSNNAPALHSEGSSSNNTVIVNENVEDNQDLV